VNEEEPIPGTPMNLLKAFLPVAESFGFSALLRGAT
jgi:elongation factor 2